MPIQNSEQKMKRLEFPPDAPWLQKKGERDGAYAQFMCFLGLNPVDRNLLNASNKYRAQHGHKSTLKPSGPFYKWSARNKWTERAEAYDKWIAEMASAKDAEEKIDRMASIKDNMAELVDELLKELLEAHKTGNPVKINEKQANGIAAYLFGKGGAFAALAAGHKAVVGEKHELTHKGSIVDWKI